MNSDMEIVYAMVNLAAQDNTSLHLSEFGVKTLKAYLDIAKLMEAREVDLDKFVRALRDSTRELGRVLDEAIGEEDKNVS